MSTEPQSSNVTGTGIAVAVAVIIAVGLLFFGKQIYGTLTTNYSQSSTTPAQQLEASQQATQTQTTNSATNSSTNQTAMTDSNTSSAPTGIPANVTQLLTKDEVIGTGAEAKPGDSVTVQYVGMLTNGTVFDASANHGTQGFTFTLGAGQVIKGWDEGVAGMKVGGKRELVIPASLGYGAQAVGTIPANSTLVFEVELQAVQSPAAQ
jgi:FKBP-type peptidyl-prolyl cis-trans isomerase